MVNNWPPYRFYSLGDSAITLDFGNVIDEAINRKVISLFYSINRTPLVGMVEAVPAYSSLTIYYDVCQLRKKVPETMTVAEWIKDQFMQRLEKHHPENDPVSKHIKIPVCYEKDFALDIEEVALAKNIPVEEIIQIHTSKNYHVYMLGFLPGFTYMGQIDEQIEMPRRSQPRQKVETGSVGIAGRQTGIYPLASPGGWQIIGRTPLKLFDANNNEPVLLKAGYTVQFYSITKNEFESY